MRLKDLNEKSFAELVQGERPTVLLFGTDWCTPCKRLERVLVQELSPLVDQLALAKVNVEDEPEIARRLEVTKSPTLCLLDGGETVRKHEGFVDAEGLRRLLKEASFPH